MKKALSDTEKALLAEKGVIVKEWLGGGVSCDVYAIKPYQGESGLCVKFIRDARKRDVEDEYERYRSLYMTEPGRFTKPVDLIRIEVPDEDRPEKSRHCAALVMEQLEKVDKSALTTEMIVKILFDCAICLGYMHILGIMHRDVKLENVMYCRRTGTYVLLDYGVSAFGRGTFSEDSCKGSPNEISPGALRGNYSRRDDFFSLGRTIRSIFVGREIDYPSQAELNGQKLTDYLYEKVAALQPLDENEFDNPELIRIVNKMTEFDRDDRYLNFDELLSDLKKLIRDQHINVGRISNFPHDYYVAMIRDGSHSLPKETIRKAFHEYLKRSRVTNAAVCIVPFSDTVYTRELYGTGDDSVEIVLCDEDSDFLSKLRKRVRKAGVLPDRADNARIHVCVTGSKPLRYGIRGLAQSVRQAVFSQNSVPVAYRVTVSDDYAFDVSEIGVSEIVPVGSSASLFRCLDRWFCDDKEAIA